MSKSNPSANGSSLRKPQIAVLQALKKANKAMSRKQIAEKANTDLAFLTTWIGANDPDKRKSNEAKSGIKGLLTLGYVKAEEHEGEGMSYSITSKGKTALEKATA